jgi:hypothetical protein
MKKAILTALVLITVCGTGMAQDSFSRMMVDSPTAGLIPRGSYSFGVRVSQGGGMLGELDLGIFERFELGFSYGGMNIVGSGDIHWNPRVEFQAKYRLIDETVGFPAIAIGYDSQGYGAYHKELERYDIKSMGFYGVLSKNYTFLGEMGLHAGYSVSMEGRGDDRGEPTFFAGTTVGFNPDLMIMLEYNLPISNDSIARSLDEGKGYFNAGFRMRLVESLSIEVDVRNINQNAMASNRMIRIIYESPFF